MIITAIGWLALAFGLVVLAAAVYSTRPWGDTKEHGEKDRTERPEPNIRLTGTDG